MKSIIRNLMSLDRLVCAAILLGLPVLISGTYAQEKTQKPKKAAAVKAKKKASAKKSADAHDHEHEHDTKTQAAKKTDKTTQDSQSGYDPLKAKGMINEIAEPLAKLLKFQRKGEALKLDVPETYSEGSAAFQQIRSKARGGGGGHGSGNFWTQYISSQTLGGRIQRSEQNFGRNKPKPDSLTAEFLESADDNTSLEIQADSANEFLIRVNGGLNPFYLQIQQTKQEFVVNEVNGHIGFAAKGSSFEDFCRTNPDYVQSRLLPLMKHYGLSSPITRFNSVTRDHVLALLSPADNEELNRFKQTFKNLESTKYEEREEASKKLKAEFDKWKDVLRFAAGSDKFSIEVRSRLQKLIKEKSSEADRQLISLVAAGDLVNDTEYLVWLLSQTEEAKQKTNITTKLKSLTKQDFGNDLAAWKKYLNGNGNAGADAASETSVQTTPSLSDSEGYLPQMAEPTANLLRLTLSDGKLKLDRKFWASQFNGETIKTHVERLQKQLEKSNLPKRWLNTGGGYSLNYVYHEHVLFEHIQSVIPSQMSPNYYSYGNLSSYRNSQINRNVEQPHIYMQLIRERQKTQDNFRRVQGSKNKANVFRFSARERRDSHLELSMVEREDSTLFLTIGSPQSRSVFHLYQDAKGKVSCHLAGFGKNVSVTADNFEQLYKQNKKYMETIAYPVFARFGIQVPKEVGGPLTIKNAAKPKKVSS